MVRKNKKTRRNFGWHLILDLYSCDPKTVGNLEVCYDYLNTMPDLMGVHKQSPPFIVVTDGKKYPDKAGLSGWIPIVESGISVHTLTVTNFISIDIYSCQKFNNEKLIEFTKRTFKPKKIEKKFLLRGESYYK